MSAASSTVSPEHGDIPAPWLASAGWLLVTGLAHVPVLFEYGRSLWQMPHYQFFPVAVAGAVLLAYRGLKESRFKADVPLWSIVAAFTVDFGLLLVAVLLPSPWVGAIAALSWMVAAALALGGFRLLWAVLPAIVVCAVLVRLPMGWNTQFVDQLQTLTTRTAAATLDVLRVEFIPQGNIIELPSRRLFVAEACTGINSFFVLLAASLFYAFWFRLGIGRSLFLLLLLPLCVLASNTVRVVGVVVLSEKLGWEADKGLLHEAVGVLTFGLTLFLLWSADGLGQAADALVRLQLFGERDLGDDESSNPSRGGFLRALPTYPVPFKVAAVCLFVAVAVASLLPTETVRAVVGLSTGRQRWDGGIPQLGEDFAPASYRGAELVSYKTEERGLLAEMGAMSQFWTYDAPTGTTQLSIDYFFPSWHELSLCYRNMGWRIDDREVIREGDDEFIEVRMSFPSEGRHAVLYFTLIDPDGETLPPRDLGLDLSQRLFREWLEGVQVQVFRESTSPIDAEHREAMRTLLLETLESLRARNAS